MHHFHLEWTSHVTLYVGSSDMQMRKKKVFQWFFYISLNIDMSDKPANESVKKDLFF